MSDFVMNDCPSIQAVRLDVQYSPSNAIGCGLSTSPGFHELQNRVTVQGQCVRERTRSGFCKKKCYIRSSVFADDAATRAG